MRNAKSKLVALVVVVATLIGVQLAPAFSGSASALSMPQVASPTILADDDNSFDTDCFTGNPLSWFLCPFLDMAKGAAQALDDLIASSLKVDTDKDSAMHRFYGTWSVIRNLSLGLAVVAALVVVVLHMMGLEVLSAYTIQKAVPRVAIVLIGISLSWPLCMWFIGLTNDLGDGVRALIYSTIEAGGGGAIDIKNMTLATLIGTLLGAGGIFFTLTIAGSLTLLGTAALAAFVGFMTLLLRQLLMVILVVTAPIAAACYILPGTQKIWKMWWDSFYKGLLMYPLIMAFIATGHVFAAIFSQESTMGALIGFIVYFAPYFMLPMTFRMAGGMVSAVGGMMQQSTAGMRQGLAKSRAQQRGARMQKIKSGNAIDFAKPGSKLDSINKGLERASYFGKAGYNPRKWNERMKAAQTAAGINHGAHMAEDAEYAAVKGDDGWNRAAAEARDANDFRAIMKRQDPNISDTNLNAAEAQYHILSRKYGTEAFRQSTALQAIAGGTATKDGADMLQLINHVSEGNDAVRASLIARGRQAAMAAGRVDEGGASFGATLKAAQDLDVDMTAAGADTQQQQAAIDKAQAAVVKSVVESQGADVLTHPSMKPRSMENIVPELNRRLDAAIQQANATGDTKQLDAELAAVMNIHDTLQRSSPTIANEVAENVLQRQVAISSSRPQARLDVSGQPVRGDTGEIIYDEPSGASQQRLTTRQLMEERRISIGGDNTDLTNRRREYGPQADDPVTRAKYGPGGDPGSRGDTLPK